MGQEHNNTTLPDPLGLTAADELVKDALGIVSKVSELSFPADQAVGIGH